MLALPRPTASAYRAAGTMLAISLLAAASASAQHGGPMPGMNPGMPIGHNWDVTEHDLSNVEIHDLKKAYREGVADLREGACPSATSKLDFVLEHVQNDAEVEYVAATAYRCVQDFRAASEHYEAVLELDADHYPSYRFLGVSLLALGDFDGATRRFVELEGKHTACDPRCSDDLETAYASLHKALKYVRGQRTTESSE